MPAIANGQAVVQPSTTTADATTTLSDAELLGAMIPEVYEQLRNLAQNYLRGERVNHTLQATALVHEAYLRLRDQRHHVLTRDRTKARLSALSPDGPYSSPSQPR